MTDAVPEPDNEAEESDGSLESPSSSAQAKKREGEMEESGEENAA
jgi:hypothetical protein